MTTATLAPAGAAAGAALPVILGHMLLCSFLWAGSLLLMKLLGGALSPLALTALRGLMGGGLIALWLLLVLREGVVPRGREWRDWAVLGLVQGVIPNTLTAYALSEITTGLAAMIQATTPLMVATLAHALFVEERLSARRAAGVLTGFTGMMVLLAPTMGGGLAGGVAGTLAMAATAASYAAGGLYVRAIPNARPLRLALGQQAFAGLPMLAVVLAGWGPVAFAGAADHLLTLAALGIFGTALPIVLFMRILRMAGPTLGSMNGYLIPVWTVLLGTTLLKESVTPHEIAGGIVVLAGVALASRRHGR